MMSVFIIQQMFCLKTFTANLTANITSKRKKVIREIFNKNLMHHWNNKIIFFFYPKMFR